MYDDDLQGLNPSHNIGQPSGGVAPSRHALQRQRYLESKRKRLRAESIGRRRVAAGRVVANAAARLHGMVKAAGGVLRMTRIRWRMTGIQEVDPGNIRRNLEQDS